MPVVLRWSCCAGRRFSWAGFALVVVSAERAEQGEDSDLTAEGKVTHTAEGSEAVLVWCRAWPE